VRIGVLALQGDVAEHRRALIEVGADAVSVRRPGDLVGLDGIVLPGGESTTMSMLVDSSGLRQPLAEALARGLPAFGTCAGLILLASTVVDGRVDQRTFGVIDLVVRRNGYGRQAQSFECDLVVTGMPEDSMHAVFIRAPVVVSAGPEVEALAWASAPDATTKTVVACRQGRVLVTSFHPELTSDRRLHRLFVTMATQGYPGRTGDLDVGEVAGRSEPVVAGA